MGADALATRGVRASATMTFTMLNRIDSIRTLQADCCWVAVRLIGQYFSPQGGYSNKQYHNQETDWNNSRCCHRIIPSHPTTPICYSSQLNQYEDEEVKTSVTAVPFTTKLTVDIYISSSLTTDVQRNLVSHFEKWPLGLIGGNILKIFNNRGKLGGNIDDFVSLCADNNGRPLGVNIVVAFCKSFHLKYFILWNVNDNKSA